MAITINGSGTVTGITAGGLPDAIITQPELATGVAGTGPAFSAYSSANQTGISNSTWTKIQLNTEEFDTNNCFDNVTNYRFTPTTAGYYQIDSSIAFNASVVNPTFTRVGIYKNGSLYKVAYCPGSSADRVVPNASCLVYLNGSTDYVELYGYLVGATGGQFDGGSAPILTTMSGAMVRSA